jgi:hypothetical protein
MATPDNPLNLLDYFATKPVLSKVKNTIIFNYFNMLSCFSVFANPSTLPDPLSHKKTADALPAPGGLIDLSVSLLNLQFIPQGIV